MIHLDFNAIHRLVCVAELLPPLREAFAGAACVPPRAHHEIEVPNGTSGTLLLMPAWRTNRFLGVKIATVFPDNSLRSIPTVIAQYLLLSSTTGEAHALLDGRALTLLRTAAVSSLAADYLARRDTRCLLMVGTGDLAPYLIEAHMHVRKYERVLIWGRNAGKAQRLALEMRNRGMDSIASADLESAAREADVISCATLSSSPLINGTWLKSGAHLDLVGSFRPAMREADDEAVRRARIFTDSALALEESGDLCQPIQAGVLRSDAIGLLSDLARGLDLGARSAHDITVFKSVGTALSDLAAAELILEKAKAVNPSPDRSTPLAVNTDTD